MRLKTSILFDKGATRARLLHEIKNPLTPMRLTIQSFQNKYDSNDHDNKEKISNFSDLLIQ